MAAFMVGNGRGNGGGRKRYRPLSEINVTPLVDVMLVLLIVFMVTAPLLTVGVPVDLPKTEAAQLTDEVEPLVVSVNAEGVIFLQETEVPRENLIPRLNAVTGQRPDVRIFVRGDKSIQYGTVMEVMGLISAAGFTKVALLAEIPDVKGAN
ncbi:protein TolR [Nisaea acidiphila]|uniref:Protein TolR n=1 Tax=Nisaea acidiphila TaxID=1862145 RepID=A0A9J7ANN5_9PROT|nr:protein TolR [Nisaea acidiphila]UUX48774.1 protein TolR [Nisaea acidiphila]